MEKTKTSILAEVVDLIVDALNLHYVDKQNITESTLLMADGLGLDSVDILEVVVAVEQQYGLKIVNAEQGKQVFQSVGTICDFILANHGGRRDSTTQEQSI